MMDDLQPPYTPEQLRELEHADELEKLRIELSEDCVEAVRVQHHRAHYKMHCLRMRIAEDLASLLDVNTDPNFESVQDKVKALLEKYDPPIYPVIYVDGEYHSDYSEEAEKELNDSSRCYAVYNLTAKQKEYVLKNKLSELEIPL